MKGQLGDGNKGFIYIGIFLLIYGSSCIISFLLFDFVMFPFLILGSILATLGIIVLIPHEYIDKKINKLKGE